MRKSRGACGHMLLFAPLCRFLIVHVGRQPGGLYLHSASEQKIRGDPRRSARNRSEDRHDALCRGLGLGAAEGALQGPTLRRRFGRKGADPKLGGFEEKREGSHPFWGALLTNMTHPVFGADAPPPQSQKFDNTRTPAISNWGHGFPAVHLAYISFLKSGCGIWQRASNRNKNASPPFQGPLKVAVTN